nr:hypothetical protein [uncultured Rhodopila sp.]
MISPSLAPISRLAAALTLSAAFAGLPASPADARVFVGIGVGVPFYGYGPGFYPAPFYYPPPVYYAPPPVFYTPPPQVFAPGPAAQPGGGQACYAGPYVCPMDRPVAPGSTCYCLGNGGQRVWGRSN